MHVSFADKAITAATTVVHGKLPYVPVELPFPVDNSDACKDQGIECPMAAGKTYTFKTVLPIKSMYPTVSTITLSYSFKGRLCNNYQKGDVENGLHAGKYYVIPPPKGVKFIISHPPSAILFTPHPTPSPKCMQVSHRNRT